MIAKKLALLGVASVATLGMGISIAGGPATCAPAAQVSGVYAGVNVGGSYDNSMKFEVSSVSSTTPVRVGGFSITSITGANYSHAPWGWTIDALVGYQFNNNWALQLGYIWNQQQKLSATLDDNNTSSAQAATYDSKTYNLYLGIRGMLPLCDNFNAYMMVGPAWTHLKLKADYASAADVSASDSYWSPMGALGVTWHIDSGFSVDLQYMYIMSDPAVQSANSLKGFHRGVQRVTVGAAYLFAM